MDIAYLSKVKIPSRLANSIQIVNMCDAFCSHKHTVTLYHRKGDKLVNNKNIEEYYRLKHSVNDVDVNVPKSRILNLYASLWIARDAQKRNFGLLYSRDAYSLFFSRKQNTPLAYEAHQPPKHKFRKSVEKRLFTSSNFTKLIVISNSLYRYYLDEFDILDQSDVVVAPDGAKNIDQQPISKSRLTSGKIDVGYTGSIIEGRGITTILQMANDFNGGEFHIVGGTDSQIEFWKNNSHVPENVTFHGYVPYSEISNYYELFDVLLAPYESEVTTINNNNTTKWMSPLKIFEYMSAGRPIIASDLNALREILTDGHTALLVSPNDPNEWVDALKRLTTGDLGKQLAENSKNEFLSNYTWQIRAKRILDSLLVCE